MTRKPRTIAEAVEERSLTEYEYIRKTAEIAYSRKYYDNLPVDLAAVKKNPKKAQRFVEVYPEKFHSFLVYVLKPRAFNALMKNWKTTQLRNIKEINKELDKKFARLAKKYPLADEDSVVAAAQAKLDLKRATSKAPSHKITITNPEWDNLWRESHARVYRWYQPSVCKDNK